MVVSSDTVLGLRNVIGIAGIWRGWMREWPERPLISSNQKSWKNRTTTREYTTGEARVGQGYPLGADSYSTVVLLSLQFEVRILQLAASVAGLGYRFSLRALRRTLPGPRASRTKFGSCKSWLTRSPPRDRVARDRIQSKCLLGQYSSSGADARTECLQPASSPVR